MVILYLKKNVYESHKNMLIFMYLFIFLIGSPIVKVSKEKIEVVDAPNKTFSYNIIDGDLLKYYKSFKAHVTVVPKEEGSLVKWSCEYEKANEEIPDPSLIKEFAEKNFKELDDYLGKQA